MAARHQPSLLSKPPLLPLEPQLDSFCPSPLAGQGREQQCWDTLRRSQAPGQKHLVHEASPTTMLPAPLRQRTWAPSQALHFPTWSPETRQTGLALRWCLCWTVVLQVFPHCMRRAVEVQPNRLMTVGMLNSEKARLQLTENKSAAEVGSFCISNQACTGVRAVSRVSHPALNIP